MIDIWLYTWPDLYTRLVTYARLYILTLVVSFYHDIRYISFMIFFDIEYSVIFCFSLSCCYCLHCFYARAPFPLHTHTLIRSLLTTLNLHVQILDVLCPCSGVRWARTLCESLEFFSFGSGILISLVFMLFPGSRYISDSVFISILYLYDIMHRCLYVILQWSWFIIL